MNYYRQYQYPYYPSINSNYTYVIYNNAFPSHSYDTYRGTNYEDFNHQPPYYVFRNPSPVDMYYTNPTYYANHIPFNAFPTTEHQNFGQPILYEKNANRLHPVGEDPGWANATLMAASGQ